MRGFGGQPLCVCLPLSSNEGNTYAHNSCSSDWAFTLVPLNFLGEKKKIRGGHTVEA